jgi:hypothetical protein
MDDCKLSNRPSDEYWIEGRDFDWKKCVCGKIYRLKDNEAFPPHKPKPLKETTPNHPHADPSRNMVRRRK